MDDEIDLPTGTTLAEGWHPVERAADGERPYRWTSLVSGLVVDPREAGLAEGGHLILSAGSPDGQEARQLAVVGPGGTVRRPVEAGWHTYEFPIREVLGPSPGSRARLSIEVDEPVRAAGEARTLGVMVVSIGVGGGPAPAESAGPPPDVVRSPGVSLGEGWYDLEHAIDGTGSFRWTFPRSELLVDLDATVPPESSLVLHVGSPATNAGREIVVRGAGGGQVTRPLRSGWDYYAFPLAELVGDQRSGCARLRVDVGEPFRAPGDGRTLGVMVDQVMLEDGGRKLPFVLVDGFVASVRDYRIDDTPLKVCDYAESKAADIVVGELQGDQYHLAGIEFEPGDVVIDIGGHIGLFSISLAKKHPFLRILAFEPIPMNYRMFRKNVALNDTPNVRVYNLAVTSDGRDLELIVHLRGNTAGATANLGRLDVADHDTFRCPSLTLDDIFDTFLVQSCKLLKIDCEGSEHEILLGARALARVQHLRGEFHINRHLRERGYSIEGLADHCRALIGPDRVVFTSCDMFE